MMWWYLLNSLCCKPGLANQSCRLETCKQLLVVLVWTWSQLHARDCTLRPERHELGVFEQLSGDLTECLATLGHFICLLLNLGLPLSQSVIFLLVLVEVFYYPLLIRLANVQL